MSNQVTNNPAEALRKLATDCQDALELLRRAAKKADRVTDAGEVVIGGSAIIRAAVTTSEQARFVQLCLKSLTMAVAERQVVGGKDWWWSIKDGDVTPETLEKLMKQSDHKLFQRQDPYGLKDFFTTPAFGPVTTRQIPCKACPETEAKLAASDAKIKELEAQLAEARKQLDQIRPLLVKAMDLTTTN